MKNNNDSWKLLLENAFLNKNNLFEVDWADDLNIEDKSVLFWTCSCISQASKRAVLPSKTIGMIQRKSELFKKEFNQSTANDYKIEQGLSVVIHFAKSNHIPLISLFEQWVAMMPSLRSEILESLLWKSINSHMGELLNNKTPLKNLDPDDEYDDDDEYHENNEIEIIAQFYNRNKTPTGVSTVPFLLGLLKIFPFAHREYEYVDNTYSNTNFGLSGFSHLIQGAKFLSQHWDKLEQLESHSFSE